MTEFDKNWMTEKIFETLQRRQFAEWYFSGRFNHWITSDLPDIEDEDIKNDIRKMFGL